MINQFTVIATCYNDELVIPTYYSEMAKQTIQPCEYILVDGGSKDNSIKVAMDCQSDMGLNIRTVSKGRLNIAQGYNEGIKESKTNCIIITGIGNKYDTHFFEELLNYYNINECQVVYGVTYGTGKSNFSKAYSKVFVGGQEGLRNSPTNRGMLIEKAVFERIGYFYEKFVYAGEDSEFTLLMKKNGIKIGFAKNAKLFWETPEDYLSYSKQRNNYSIGRMQVYGVNRNLITKSLCLWALTVISAIMIFLNCRIIGILFICLIYLAGAYSVKSFRPLDVGLKIDQILSEFPMYMKNKKYSKGEYRVIR